MIEIGVGVTDHKIDNMQPVVLFFNDDAIKALQVYAGKDLPNQKDLRQAVVDWVQDAMFEIIMAFVEDKRTDFESQVFCVDFVEDPKTGPDIYYVDFNKE